MGGLIFNTYSEAKERAEKENYPDDNKGIVPTAKGRFIRPRHFEEDVYVPA